MTAPAAGAAPARECSGLSTPATPTSWHAFDIGSQALPGSPGFQKILIDLGLPLPGTDRGGCYEGNADFIDDLVREFGDPGHIIDQAPTADPNAADADADAPAKAEPDDQVPLPPVAGRRRAQRKMVAEDAKDEKYKRRRAKNTVYAKRSRDRARAKRQADDIRLTTLASENAALRARLLELESRIAEMQPPQGQLLALLC